MSEELYRIEDEKPEEVETVRAIIRDAWIRLYPNEAFGITKKDLEDIDWFNEEGMKKRRREITDQRDVVHNWVMKNKEDKIVGFCKASKKDEVPEINAVYLLPEVQGLGLGKKLVQKALEWLGSNYDIIIKVVSYNTHAIEFYKKFDFVDVGPLTSYDGTPLLNGKDLPRIKMVRKKSI